jgi:hypothetical protein
MCWPICDVSRASNASISCGLGLDEITTFMELAAGHDLDAPGIELARAVHRETEGNAFFVSEMIRHLAEAGYIVQRDGRLGERLRPRRGRHPRRHP